MLLLQKFEIPKQFVKFGPEVLDGLEKLSLRNLAETLNTYAQRSGGDLQFFVTPKEELAVRVPAMYALMMGSSVVKLSAEVEAKVRKIADVSPSGPPVPALVPVFDIRLPFDDSRANLGLWVPQRAMSGLELILERSNGHNGNN